MVLLDGHTELFKDLQTLLLVLLTRHPEVVPILHDVGKNSSSKEHHVLTTRGIFNSNFEFLCVEGLKEKCVSVYRGRLKLLFSQNKVPISSLNWEILVMIICHLFSIQYS